MYFEQSPKCDQFLKLDKLNHQVYAGTVTNNSQTLPLAVDMNSNYLWMKIWCLPRKKKYN